MFAANRCFRILVAAVLLLAGAAAKPAEPANTGWYLYNDSDTVVVFVHGFGSNSKDCWTAQSGVYWPNLVNDDKRLKSPSVYLGGYFTSVNSLSYGIPDAATNLLSKLTTTDPSGRAPPLSKQRVIFVAHSTGGLVVRYMLDRKFEHFKDKSVGLVLLASPSRGSAWANRLRWIREYFGNRLVGQLERDNDLIMDLDRTFADLAYERKRIPKLVGVDAFEAKFIIDTSFLPWLKKEYVVSATDSASYFGAYRTVADSDHFSIAKPTSLTHDSHQLLLELFETKLQNTESKQPTLSERYFTLAYIDKPNLFLEMSLVAFKENVDASGTWSDNGGFLTYGYQGALRGIPGKFEFQFSEAKLISGAFSANASLDSAQEDSFQATCSSSVWASLRRSIEEQYQPNPGSTVETLNAENPEEARKLIRKVVENESFDPRCSSADCQVLPSQKFGKEFFYDGFWSYHVTIDPSPDLRKGNVILLSRYFISYRYVTSRFSVEKARCRIGIVSQWNPPRR